MQPVESSGKSLPGLYYLQAAGSRLHVYAIPLIKLSDHRKRNMTEKSGLFPSSPQPSLFFNVLIV